MTEFPDQTTLLGERVDTGAGGIRVLGSVLLVAGVWFVRGLEVTLVFLPVLSGQLSVTLWAGAGLLGGRSLLPRRPVSD